MRFDDDNSLSLSLSLSVACASRFDELDRLAWHVETGRRFAFSYLSRGLTDCRPRISVKMEFYARQVRGYFSVCKSANCASVKSLKACLVYSNCVDRCLICDYTTFSLLYDTIRRV